MNSTIYEMKNTLEGNNIKTTEAEEWINEVEDRVVKINAIEKNNNKKKKKNERNEKISKRPLVHYKTYKHLYYRGSRGEERDKGPEKIFEEIID